MRKITVFVLMMFVIGQSFAQEDSITNIKFTDFNDPLNMVIGLGRDFTDLKDNESDFNFQYLSYFPFKLKENISFGVFGMRWGSRSHYDQYQQKVAEYLVGPAIKIFLDSVISDYNLYLGFNVGYKTSHNDGWENSFSRNQNDGLLCMSIYASLFRNKNSIFNRIEFDMSYQTELNSSVNAYWENKPIEGKVWNKDYFSARIKASVIPLNLVGRWFLTPKAILTYDHEFHNGRKYFGIGAGLNLYKLHRMDWINVYYVRKFSPTDKPVNRIGIEMDMYSLWKILK